MRIRARMEQNEDGRELKKEEPRQDRHLEKAVMRSVEDDPELRRVEEEHKLKLVEIEMMMVQEARRREKRRGETKLQNQTKAWTTRAIE